MKKFLFWFIALSLTAGFTSCKTKLEKKDQSQEEMQEDNGNKENYIPVISSADATPVYKKINDTTEMHLNIYYPENHHKGDNKACIIYFFAGSFINGSPSQFEEHCKYLCSRGMVAISADYRVMSRNKGNALNCIYDAKSAVRFIRENANEYGVDPNKIVVAGGSAGGMLAIECAINDPKWQDPSDNTGISCIPNALVLINPVVNSEEFPFRIRKFKDNDKTPDSLSHAPEINPIKHISSGMPPAIMFHGTMDKMSAYHFAKQFADDYTAAGNKMDLHSYPRQKHGFSSIKNANGKFYRDTLRLTDEFLISLGYLSGTPTIPKEDLNIQPVKKKNPDQKKTKEKN